MRRHRYVYRYVIAILSALVVLTGLQVVDAPSANAAACRPSVTAQNFSRMTGSDVRSRVPVFVGRDSLWDSQGYGYVSLGLDGCSWKSWKVAAVLPAKNITVTGKYSANAGTSTGKYLAVTGAKLKAGKAGVAKKYALKLTLTLKSGKVVTAVQKKAIAFVRGTAIGGTFSGDNVVGVVRNYQVLPSVYSWKTGKYTPICADVAEKLTYPSGAVTQTTLANACEGTTFSLLQTEAGHYFQALTLPETPTRAGHGIVSQFTVLPA